MEFRSEVSDAFCPQPAFWVSLALTTHQVRSTFTEAHTNAWECYLCRSTLTSCKLPCRLASGPVLETKIKNHLLFCHCYSHWPWSTDMLVACMEKGTWLFRTGSGNSFLKLWDKPVPPPPSIYHTSCRIFRPAWHELRPLSKQWESQFSNLPPSSGTASVLFLELHRLWKMEDFIQLRKLNSTIAEIHGIWSKLKNSMILVQTLKCVFEWCGAGCLRVSTICNVLLDLQMKNAHFAAF